MKPSLDLFPRKCTYAKVIDLRIMVLWSIAFIANRHRIPHQISLCPLLLPGIFFGWQVPRSTTNCIVGNVCYLQLIDMVFGFRHAASQNLSV